MTVLDETIQQIVTVSWVWLRKAEPQHIAHPSVTPSAPSKKRFDPLYPLRQWLDNLEMRSPEQAHWICQTIPAQCPFERDVKLFGKTLFHIPPLCKLNPLYEQFVYLRFRALSYLAEDCGEDITPYI
ncbi:Mo-dependent nitrogenase C-terminal domain-containing protein [Baaleninema sp.]|uniref:Mo-dependent nitrogenase C-terminal domain-containing protein n=1 Tax=Baaleninema sp. TaxID=3101197 RepID=UPI003D00AB33